MTGLRSLKIAAVAAAGLTYLLIVLGGLVRVTDSGLSCPDWPTCYGHWVPLPADIAAVPGITYTYGQVMLEWVHRLIAGVLLGPIVLAIAVLAVILRGRDPGLPWLGIGLLVLLLVQGGLGAFTVFDSNSPWSVAVHLGNALVILALLILVATRAAGLPVPRPPAPAVPLLAAIAAALALGAMASAAMTTKSGAALACATWPDCNGAWLPDLSDPLVAIHFAHRLLAAATGVAVLALWLACRRRDPARRRLASLALALVVAQVGLGALVIVWQVPLLMAVLHQAVGVLLFVVVCRLLWRAAAIGRPAPVERSSDGLALHGA